MLLKIQSTINIAASTLDDIGQWTCVASNTVGDDSVTYNIDIIQPPTEIPKPGSNLAVTDLAFIHTLIIKLCSIYKGYIKFNVSI